MNELEGILKEIERRGIVLKTDGNQIFYTPITALPNEMKDQLRIHKEAIIRLLQEKKSLIVFSKVLNREIKISWSRNSRNVVYVDRTPYTPEEIAKLKSRDPSSIKIVHLLKENFQGRIVDKD